MRGRGGFCEPPRSTFWGSLRSCLSEPGLHGLTLRVASMAQDCKRANCVAHKNFTRVYCILTVSSKVNSTSAVFPGSTFTGAGWPGVLVYIPSDEPGGDGPCRSA